MPVLVIDKGTGLTSFGVVKKVQGIFRTWAHKRGDETSGAAAKARFKAGHGGTLDPLASGVLPVFIGEATKIAPFLLAAEKTYEATVVLGVTTDTLDAEGKVLSEKPVEGIDQAQVEAALSGFRGPIWQVPPMYSALKKDGKALYEYAREGKELEREARPVEIYELTLQDFSPPNVIKLFVHCSKGTYIRTLADDLGRVLGCGAHLGGLRRVRSGPFCLDNAIDLAALQVLADAGDDLPSLPLRDALSPMPLVTVDDVIAGRVRMGQKVTISELACPDNQGANPFGLVNGAGGLLAIVEAGAEELKILRGFDPTRD